jgi:hypothetical protein
MASETAAFNWVEVWQFKTLLHTFGFEFEIRNPILLVASMAELKLDVHYYCVFQFSPDSPVF